MCELLQAREAIHRARWEFARTVRKLSVAASARTLGISSSGLSQRIKRIEEVEGK